MCKIIHHCHFTLLYDDLVSQPKSSILESMETHVHHQSPTYNLNLQAFL